MDYALTTDGEVGWDRPVRVTCLCCHASLTIGAGDVLPAGAQTTCHRCGATVALPGPVKSCACVVGADGDRSARRAPPGHATQAGWFATDGVVSP